VKPIVRRRSRRGFTLIEVMVSLGIMMIGAMAVIGLQMQTMRANGYARQLTTATQIAQIWVERIKQDACLWTQRAALTANPPETVLASVALARTRYLGAILGQRNAWVSPADSAAPVSRGFDFQGNDTLATAGLTYDRFPFYCAAYRLNWVFFGEAIRADVRVWWPRAGSAANPVSDFDGCGSGGGLASLDPGGSAIDNYHAVYVSTVMRVTPVKR
jgi:prepilin-type N-terminal cleavage/methylation domain-containing protein